MLGRESSKPDSRVTIVADATNELITLNRVVSLLRARQFSTVSVSAAQTRTPDVARLTIVINAEQTKPERVVDYLLRLPDVWNVAVIDIDATLCREIALVTLAVPPGKADVLPPDLVGPGPVRVIHRDDRSMVLEIVAPPAEVDDVLNALDPSAIIDLVRASRLTMPTRVAPLTLHAYVQRPVT